LTVNVRNFTLLRSAELPAKSLLCAYLQADDIGNTMRNIMDVSKKLDNACKYVAEIRVGSEDAFLLRRYAPRLAAVLGGAAIMLATPGPGVSPSFASDEYSAKGASETSTISDRAREVPEFTWSGFYAGSNFGGGFGVGSKISGFATDEVLAPNAYWAFQGANPGGVLGGLQAGRLWQFDRFVAGIEADIQAAGLSGGSSGFGTSLPTAQLVTTHHTIDWFGTIRGRFGYAMAPTLLLYGSGGFAYGGGGYGFSSFNGAGLSGIGTREWTRPGWAAGGGVEWAFLPDWSAKLEYLYVDLGRTPPQAFNLADANGDTVGNAASLSGSANRFHAVRAGLNYHFNISGPDIGAESDSYRRPASDKFHEIETHYIFGFTHGSDIDAEGEKEIEVITRVDQGRRRLNLAPDDPAALARLSQGIAGDYHAIAQKVEFEHTLTQNFQYALGVMGINHRISGVEGLDDHTGTNLFGLSGEFRYVLLGRGPESPIGVTLQAEPEWGHVSRTSGQSETAVEIESRLVVDTEFIPNRLYGALNLIYEPEVSRGLGEQKWGRESTLGVTGGLTYRVTPQLALGAGVQYYRAHSDGYWFNKLEGQALYAGPTLFWRLEKKLFVSAAFSAQAVGHAAGETHSLDLANFSRYMARLQFGIEF
jgi:opacity protein-like surface antigen